MNTGIPTETRVDLPFVFSEEEALERNKANHGRLVSVVAEYNIQLFHHEETGTIR